MKASVIKYGGAAMEDKAAATEIMREIATLAKEGRKPVLVHGGGREIERMLSRLDIPTKKLEGLRVTDGESMEIVEMILSGKINKGLVGLLQSFGAKAVGLSGRDGGLFIVEKKGVKGGDLGFVGAIVKTDMKLIESLMLAGYIPVISSIGDDGSGQAFNINADEAAAALATEMRASRLVLMTDVPGVLRNYPDPDSRIEAMTCDEAEKLLSSGVIDKGMIPKIRSCIQVVRGGANEAHIIDGRSPDALRGVLRGNQGFGTIIR